MSVILDVIRHCQSPMGNELNNICMYTNTILSICHIEAGFRLVVYSRRDSGLKRYSTIDLSPYE